ncbi:hypothetical protein BH23CHL2_BH23CHL2_06920 [soil metagenome]
MATTPHQKLSTSSSANLERAIERLRNASDSVEKDAFAARVVSAISRLVAAEDERVLTEATGAPSDYDVLLQALEHPAALQTLDDGPLAAAKLRGLRHREKLLNAEGGTLSSREVARILQISRQAVDKRRQAGRLIGLDTGRRGYAYPAWQFDARHGALPGIETVLAALREHDPWMQLSFMLNSNDHLNDRSPLEVLRDGELEPVRRAAQMFGEQGAA